MASSDPLPLVTDGRVETAAGFTTAARMGGKDDGAARGAWVADEVRAALAERLLTGGAPAAAANLVAAVLVGALGWPSLPHAAIATWLTLLLIASALRLLVPWWVEWRAAGAAAAVRAVRGTSALIGLFWGFGTAFAFPALPPASRALVLAVIVGLLSGASHLLIADRVASRAYAAALLLPSSVGLLLGGVQRYQLIAFGLLLLYAVVMWRLSDRARLALLAELNAAKELAFSEHRIASERTYLRALLGSAPVAVAAVEGSGRVAGVNPQFERLFGFGASEAIGRDIDELLVPAESRAEARALEAEARASQVVQREAERSRKDGRRVPVRISAAVVHGDPRGTVLVLYEDFTAVKRSEAALREAEAQYRLLVETASDLVFQVDRDGRWAFLNRAALGVYGADPEDLLGRPFVERSAPACVEPDRAALARVLEGARVVDHETTHQDVRGEARDLSFSVMPVHGPEGAVTGAIGIARDVSGQVRMRRALEEARDVAERATAAKSAFLANMSHEIRTPLNGILGMIEILLDTGLTVEQRRAAELVRTSGEALLEILNDVLDYSKIEAGQVQLESGGFDLPGLVHSVAGLLGARAFDKGIELVVDLDPRLPPRVRGDAGRLRQVLTNLVGNAVKFTPAGEVVVRVAAGSVADGAVPVRFEVRDTGIGIAADKLQAVFEEFAQADVSTTRRFGGTGLGLSISRRLVRLLGGRLEVESAEGRGSTFHFTLRLPPEEVEGARPAALTSDVLTGTRVLVVDDNATNRQVIRRFLEDARAVVTECGQAPDALVQLRAASAAGAPFGLAVIDGHMPSMDGFRLAELIRAERELAATPLMMLTSAGRRGDGERCRHLGITGYLTKPVPRMDLLEAAITVLMGGAQSGRLVTRHVIEESRRRLRILLAEDNPVNQQVAVSMLVKRGHEVDVVSNGRDAVEAVRGRRYDVVLMDVQMPGYDGLQATREIRAMPGCERMPIVAVTAYALAEERERFLAAGMGGVVAKPFRSHQLFAAVEGWDAAAPEAGTAAAPAAPPPPVDVTGLCESLREGGVEPLFRSLTSTFLRDAPGRMAEVEAAVAAGEAERIRRAAHAYKSSAGQLHAAALADALRALESAGRAGDVVEARGLARSVRAEHDRVVAFLADVGKG